MPRINADRLLDDLRTLRGFGAQGNGVVRQSLSPVDIESRHWLVERMQAAGLSAGIDGLGTVIGRSPARQALLIGSHSDTQPTGGWLDGALGVIYGLEVARALHEAGLAADRGVDVVSWIDEEGTFYGCLGSYAFCGELPDAAIDASSDSRGRKLTDALAAAGLSGLPPARLDPQRYLGYLEAHIEQGPYLEEQRQRIGVVTSIVGIRNYTIRCVGQQNHAGTTPMPRRRDAGRALIELAYEINQAFPAHAGPRSVWTIGRIAFEPGAPSIVPGGASMNLQIRDGDEEVLDALEALTRDLVTRAGVTGTVTASMTQTPDVSVASPMDAGMQEHLATAAERHTPGSWTRMPSGAGHDAQIIARHLPSGMLFIPSINGISHSFEEDSSEADIVLGCQVLASAAHSITGR